MATVKDLDAFFVEGWNTHDVDRLMTFMADDCVFESTAGPEACGAPMPGASACARCSRGSSRISATPPSATPVTSWLASAVPPSRDGKKVEVNGCDLFTFRNGKIAVKSSFFKTRTS